MQTQVVYDTNADFDASEENIRTSGLVASHVNSKGTLVFNFKDTETVFLLFHTGILQVRWRSIEEKKTLFKLVKCLLAPLSGEALRVEPKSQLKEIMYREKVRTFWCEEEIDYAVVTPRKQRELLNRLNCMMRQPPWNTIPSISLSEMSRTMTLEDIVDTLKRMR